MSPVLPIGYAVIRTGAAIALVGRAGRRGAGIGALVGQGLSDASLGLGIVAFSQPAVASVLGGFLELLVSYAVIWEFYVGLTRVAEQVEGVAGEDLSAASLARPILGVWELFAVVPAILMAVFGVENRPGVGGYLFESNALDALTAAVVGVAVLVWVARRPPASLAFGWLLRGFGVILLLVALWVWL